MRQGLKNPVHIRHITQAKNLEVNADRFTRASSENPKKSAGAYRVNEKGVAQRSRFKSIRESGPTNVEKAYRFEGLSPETRVSPWACKVPACQARSKGGPANAVRRQKVARIPRLAGWLKVVVLKNFALFAGTGGVVLVAR